MFEDYTYVVGTNVMGAIELALLHPFSPQVTWHMLAIEAELQKLDREEQVAISWHDLSEATASLSSPLTSLIISVKKMVYQLNMKLLCKTLKILSNSRAL